MTKYFYQLPYYRFFYVAVILFGLSTNFAFSQTGFIKCKAAKGGQDRIWKYSLIKDNYELWTLNSHNLFPFCSVGFSVQLPNGFLCAYDAGRKVGTIATYIDIKEVKITDILIWEDTVLDDPNSWRQKSETACEMIRN